MARQFAGRDQDRIEAHIADRRLRISRKPGFRRRGDALLLPLADRLRRLVECRARLHLDEDQQAAARRDNVDLAARALPAPRQNAVAVRDQPGRGAAFGGYAEAECRNFFRTRFALLSLRPRRRFGRPRSALRRAIAIVLRERQRALIDLAARPAGRQRHFADRIFHRTRASALRNNSSTSPLLAASSVGGASTMTISPRVSPPSA